MLSANEAAQIAIDASGQLARVERAVRAQAESGGTYCVLRDTRLPEADSKRLTDLGYQVKHLADPAGPYTLVEW